MIPSFEWVGIGLGVRVCGVRVLHSVESCWDPLMGNPQGVTLLVVLLEVL